MCGADDSLCFIQIKQSVNIFNYAYYNRCEYVLCTFDWDIFLSTRIDTIYRVINIVQCNMLLKCMVKPRTNPIVGMYIYIYQVKLQVFYNVLTILDRFQIIVSL